MHRPLRVLSLGLTLAACGDSGGEPTTAAPDTGSTTATPEATTDAPAPTTGDAPTTEGTTGPGEDAAVTYHRDIAPLLAARCVQCHSPGNIAPFSLETHAEAAPFAAMLADAAEAGTMPPFPPDAACRGYAHDVSLTAAQRELLRAWAELGAPAGDPDSAPPPAMPPPAIDYDLELKLPAPFEPSIAPDEYRCFLIDWPVAEESFVTALDVIPGERRLVHHVIAYAIEPQDVQIYRDLDDADPDPGYLCYGGPGPNEDSPWRVPWLAAWAPGYAGGGMPEGTGVRVQPGSVIAMQIHYHSYPGAGPDQSRLRLRTAAKVDRQAVIMPFTNIDWVLGTEPMHIAAGDPDAVQSFEVDMTQYLKFLFPGGPFTGVQPFQVLAAGTHQHTLGTRNRLQVVRGGGGDDECLLDIPRWDFDWQGTYELDEAVTVDPGDRLRIECHWDNSAANQPIVDGVQQPPHDVTWGEGTGDEMCLGLLYVTTP
jgi:hypothetical protein